MKREISLEKLSKKNEIERRKANRDNCSKTKRKNERKTRHLKKSTKQTKYHTILKSKISRNQTQNFFFLTKRRKNTNIDTDSETLRRLTMIVTVLTKSYFSTDDIAEFIDELNKRKRRILTQVSETFTKLSKR